MDDEDNNFQCLALKIGTSERERERATKYFDQERRRHEYRTAGMEWE